MHPALMWSYGIIDIYIYNIDNVHIMANMWINNITINFVFWDYLIGQQLANMLAITDIHA